MVPAEGGCLGVVFTQPIEDINVTFQIHCLLSSSSSSSSSVVTAYVDADTDADAPETLERGPRLRLPASSELVGM